MAELTPLDEKLAEVLGLAQAAQKLTSDVANMEGADQFEQQLEQMGQEAAETERRTDELVDTLDGKKTAIHELARKTKTEAQEMADTYLAGENEALDGFEFLTMAEAGNWVTGRSSRRWLKPPTSSRSSSLPTGPSTSSANTSSKCAPRASDGQGRGDGLTTTWVKESS